MSFDKILDLKYHKSMEIFKYLFIIVLFYNNYYIIPSLLFNLTYTVYVILFSVGFLQFYEFLTLKLIKLSFHFLRLDGHRLDMAHLLN